MKFKYSTLTKFKKFICRELKINMHFKLKLLKKYDTVQVFNYDKTKHDENTKGFAAMEPNLRLILLPLLDRNKNGMAYHIYSNMAHEYVHVWQYQNNLPFDEQEADKKAIELMQKFFNVTIEVQNGNQ
jgi:hypothetical protein